MARVTWLFLVVLAAMPALGAGPVDIYEFPDPATEARYRALIDEFRCPKCLNTNLSGSDAPIAKDLRRTIHRLVVSEGMADQQIRSFLQERYGDFVLYNPPFRPDTWILWLGPLVLVVLGVGVLVRILRQPAADPLSEADRVRLQALLASELESEAEDQ
jgi:cytochrome c-type biogenesis protein CcmH